MYRVYFLYPFLRKDDYMWTEKTKNGKYKHVERYTDPVTGKEKKVSITTEKNTAQARKTAQRALLVKIDNLLDARTISNITLSELREKWLNDKRRTWKESSYGSEKRNSRKVVEMLGENCIANNLTARYVREHITSLDEDLSLANGRISVFKRMITWGFKNDYISDKSYLDKLEKVATSTETEEDIEEKYLESDEVTKLIKGMKKEPWITLTRFLVLTGLRIGEAFSLTAADIDLKNRHIYIISNYDYINKLTDTPKTPSSKRRVYIQDELLDFARELKKEALANKLIYGSDLIFQRKGKPLVYESYHYQLSTVSQKTLGRKITPHTLRHTHTSLLAEQGVDIETISRRLGHEDSQITRKIYLHVTKKMRKRDEMQVQSIRIL